MLTPKFLTKVGYMSGAQFLSSSLPPPTARKRAFFLNRVVFDDDGVTQRWAPQIRRWLTTTITTTTTTTTTTNPITRIKFTTTTSIYLVTMVTRWNQFFNGYPTYHILSHWQVWKPPISVGATFKIIGLDCKENHCGQINVIVHYYIYLC